ncbi:MAG: Beta helix protein, partial [Parcubacteria group bacterium]|nr:Beta helix protein [Parcubacteria group bacterium]
MLVKSNFKFLLALSSFFFFATLFFPITRASADIATGLTAHWKMDETTGIVAVDSTGTNTGAVSGATWATGKLNNALSFNGTSDYVNVGNGSSLNITGTISISVWVKRLGTSSGEGHIVSKWHPLGTYALTGASGNPNFYLTDGTSYPSARGTSLLLNTWHHIVSVYDGSSLKLYQDGVLKMTTTTSITPRSSPSSNLFIGARSDGASNFLGLLDDIRIYSRALSATDITELYNYTGGEASSSSSVPQSSSSSSVQSAPAVTTNTASNITQTSTTFNATVNNNGLTATAYFQYGLTTAFGNTSPSQTVSDLGNISINSAVSNLSPSTVYYYRIVAQSSSGTTYGSAPVSSSSSSSSVSSSAGSGKTYYIDPSGNDSNDGLSQSTPWKTISKINSKTFSPGDNILFKKGGVWKEGITMYLGSSGTVSNPIIISAYGAGSKPVISSIRPLTGWDISGNWSIYSGNIWKMTYPTDSNRLWLSNGEVLKATILADVGRVNSQGTFEWWFYDAVSSTLYLYATSNPATQYISMEGNLGPSVLSIKNGTDYLTIDGIDLRGGGFFTTIFFGAASHITLKNSNVGYGNVGLAVTSSDSAMTANNIIIENNTFDSGFNFFYGRASNKIKGEKRGSEDGILLYDAVNNSIIRNNTFTGWGHSTIYLRGDDSVKDGVHDNKIYNNTFNGSNLSYGRPLGTDGVEGKSYNNEFYNNLMKNHTVRSQINGNNNWVHHNIFDGQTNSPVQSEVGWGVGEAINLSVYATNRVSHDNRIDNNLFMNTAEPAILLRSNGYTNKVTNNYIRNNIFYNTGNNSINIPNNPGVAISMEKTTEEFNNIFQNNCVFNAGKPLTNAINYYGTFLSVAQFNLKNGDNGNVVSNNIQMDPMFVDYLNKNYHLQLTSPCIDSGIVIAGLTNDFNGNPIYVGTGSDIGAYEDHVSQSSSSSSSQSSVFSSQPASSSSSVQSSSSSSSSPTKFSTNDRVITTSALNVRSTASLTGTILGTQPLSSLGYILSGPVSSGGYNWYNVNYDATPDGWSAENYLAKVVQSSSSSSSQPSSSSSSIPSSSSSQSSSSSKRTGKPSAVKNLKARKGSIILEWDAVNTTESIKNILIYRSLTGYP